MAESGWTLEHNGNGPPTRWKAAGNGRMYQVAMETVVDPSRPIGQGTYYTWSQPIFVPVR